MTQHAIFTIILIGKHKVQIFNNTEREIRSIVKTPFETLEIHKNHSIAYQRLAILKKLYRKPRGSNKWSRLAKLKHKGRWTGPLNPHYGKPLPQKIKTIISITNSGNKYRLGTTVPPKQIEKYKKKRKKWTTVIKGSKRYYSPITGQEIVVKPNQIPPDGWIRGRTPTEHERLKHNSTIHNARKYRWPKHPNQQTPPNHNHTQPSTTTDNPHNHNSLTDDQYLMLAKTAFSNSISN